MKKVLMLMAIFCLLAVSAFSQSSFAPEIKRVAVFKNGYAFTYREAEAQTNNGWAYTTNAPIGVLGTVWGYSTSPNVRVMQLLASETEKRSVERVSTISDILLANEGARSRSASDDGKISREGLNLQSVNPNSIIKWNLMLPNSEKEIRYTYKIYVAVRKFKSES